MPDRKPRWSSSGPDREGGHQITIEGLTQEERDRLKAMLGGHYWVRRGEDGRLAFHPTRQDLPSPTEDEQLAPHWRRNSDASVNLQTRLIDEQYGRPAFGASIVIQHLCGYDYTPENYRIQAGRLESYGFACLRSRRGDDGLFWEIWYLPGLWAAQGELGQEVNRLKRQAEDDLSIDDGVKLDEVIGFLCRHVSFGSLDVNVQRAAMVLD